MDIESHRCKKVKYFIESIGLTYSAKWKTFTKDLGVQVTKELKLVTNEEWDMHINSLSISKIQCRKLNLAIQNLKSTGPADPSRAYLQKRTLPFITKYKCTVCPIHITCHGTICL